MRLRRFVFLLAVAALCFGSPALAQIEFDYEAAVVLDLNGDGVGDDTLRFSGFVALALRPATVKDMEANLDAAAAASEKGLVAVRVIDFTGGGESESVGLTAGKFNESAEAKAGLWDALGTGDISFSLPLSVSLAGGTETAAGVTSAAVNLPIVGNLVIDEESLKAEFSKIRREATPVTGKERRGAATRRRIDDRVSPQQFPRPAVVGRGNIAAPVVLLPGVTVVSHPICIGCLRATDYVDCVCNFFFGRFASACQGSDDFEDCVEAQAENFVATFGCFSGGGGEDDDDDGSQADAFLDCIEDKAEGGDDDE